VGIEYSSQLLRQIVRDKTAFECKHFNFTSKRILYDNGTYIVFKFSHLDLRNNNNEQESFILNLEDVLKCSVTRYCSSLN